MNLSEKPVIAFDSIVKSFNNRVVLDSISFQVFENEIIFILGKSGSGKSVLLKNIVGLIKPDSGSISVFNKDISQFNESELFNLRRNCGMVFQNPALFDFLNIFENVAYGIRHYYDYTEIEIKEFVHYYLSLVELPFDISEKMPWDISPGIQKRISLARTIAINPSVLLIDEPTTGLDPGTTNLINDMIESLTRELNSTSIIVSHDIECALSIADRIIFLNEGIIVASGMPNEIIKSSNNFVKEFLEDVLVT